jgi:hypothetical protein
MALFLNTGLKVSGEAIKQGAFEWIYKIKKIVKERKRQRKKGKRRKKERFINPVG